MENSEVLNQPTTDVPKDGPVQKDVAPIEGGAPAVLEQNTGSMYAQAKSVTQPVGEKDHASEIAMNNEETSKTYDYNSQGAKVYDESVTTTTHQSTGKEPLSAEWNAQYGMDNAYKAEDSSEYSWNKLAAEMAQTTYDQEANQYRAESIAAKQEIDAAAASAWNNYFAAEYSARQTQDKMGWSGGQKQASDLQVSFLQAESAANMYTQDEMQRYGVESKLSIARMYADANQKALALQYYQDAIDKAVSEANLTGWYVPPEASEMFIQQDLANKILADSTASADAKARAKSVIANCEQYYANLGFERGTRKDENGKVVTEWFGIKTLATLQHEETVRNNKVNEELQRQANAISAQQLQATRDSLEVQKANLRATQAMQNRLKGVDITTEGRKTYVQHEANYYETTEYVKDKDGKIQYKDGEPVTKTVRNYINKSDNLITNSDGKTAAWEYNNNLYVKDKDGNVYQVWNSDKDYATTYATEKNKGFENNYKP